MKNLLRRMPEESSETVTVKSPCHRKTLVGGLWKLFTHQQHVDITVHCTKPVGVHRLLAQLFLETEKLTTGTVEPREMRSGNGKSLIQDSSIDCLLEFLYNGHVVVLSHHLRNLLFAAKELGFSLLSDAIELASKKCFLSNNVTLIGDGDLVTVNSLNHYDILINGLWKLYVEQLSVDCTVQWAGRHFSAHRIILRVFLSAEQLKKIERGNEDVSAVSGNQLDESDDELFNVLKSLLEFVYKGETAMPKTRLDELHAVATELNFEILVDAIKSAQDKIYIMGTLSDDSSTTVNSSAVINMEDGCDIFCNNAIKDVLADNWLSDVEPIEIDLSLKDLSHDVDFEGDDSPCDFYWNVPSVSFDYIGMEKPLEVELGPLTVDIEWQDEVTMDIQPFTKISRKSHCPQKNCTIRVVGKERKQYQSITKTKSRPNRNGRRNTKKGGRITGSRRSKTKIQNRQKLNRGRQTNAAVKSRLGIVPNVAATVKARLRTRVVSHASTGTAKIVKSTRAKLGSEPLVLTNDQILKCQYCDYRTHAENRRGLSRHQQSVHQKFKCSVCSFIFRTKLGLAQHQRKSGHCVLDRQSKCCSTFRCVQCRSNFRNKLILSQHMRVKHNGPLTTHITRAQTRRVSENDLVERCSIFHFQEVSDQHPQFNRRCFNADKLHHLQILTRKSFQSQRQESPHTCQLCPRKFKSGELLQLHLSEHLPTIRLVRCNTSLPKIKSIMPTKNSNRFSEHATLSSSDDDSHVIADPIGDTFKSGCDLPSVLLRGVDMSPNANVLIGKCHQCQLCDYETQSLNLFRVHLSMHFPIVKLHRCDGLSKTNVKKEEKQSVLECLTAVLGCVNIPPAIKAILPDEERMSQFEDNLGGGCMEVFVKKEPLSPVSTISASPNDLGITREIYEPPIEYSWLASTSNEMKAVTESPAFSSNEHDMLTSHQIKAEPGIEESSRLTFFRCTICRLVFLSKLSRDVHQCRGKKPSRVLHCGHCKYSTRHRRRLMVHMADHDASIQVLRCILCSKSFVDEQSIRYHKCKTRPINYCRTCDYSTTRKRDLRVHMAKHDSTIPIFMCNSCSRPFCSDKTFANHKCCRT